MDAAYLEDKIRELREENARLRAEVEYLKTQRVGVETSLLAQRDEARAEVTGADERAKLLLDAKNRWADRARLAEAKLARVVELEREIEIAARMGSEQHQRAEDAERELADTKKHLNYYMGRTAQAEAKLAKVVELADHGIPLYAYGDNEAAVEMSHRLEQILAAAKGE